MYGKCSTDGWQEERLSTFLTGAHRGGYFDNWGEYLNNEGENYGNWSNDYKISKEVQFCGKSFRVTFES